MESRRSFRLLSLFKIKSFTAYYGVVWYSGARLGVTAFSDIDPLWPGLIVSLLFFYLAKFFWAELRQIKLLFGDHLVSAWLLFQAPLGPEQPEVFPVVLFVHSSQK